MADQIVAVAAPSGKVQSALGGAFVAIRKANTAIALQPKMPGVDVKGLENVNSSLATAQANAKYWTDTLSQQVQNQLQHIIDYNTMYSALAGAINSGIETISQSSPQNPPTNLGTLALELSALQTQIQTLLYGSGGTEQDPDLESVLGTFNALSAYQTKVRDDENTFGRYFQIATTQGSGLDSQIKTDMERISADEEAIHRDTLLIAGGAVSVVLGALVIIVAVAIAPETGGASIPALVVGGVMVVGGAAGTIYAGVDLAKKQQDLAEAHQKLTNDKAEMSALTAIKGGTSSIANSTGQIYKALDTIKVTWQQMDNNLSSIITNLNAPQETLEAWLKTQHPGGPHNNPYQTLAIILNAQFKSPQQDWATASDTAQTILKNLGAVVEYSPQPKTMPSQQEAEEKYGNLVAA